jgi:hypothetical protein
MAEVAARASVESSVNIAYIVLGEPADRIRAYFDHYFMTVDKQVSTWNAGISALSGAEADAHHKAATRRKESNAALRAAIERSTSIAAVMQTRSRKVEMPSGLSLPLAFGMNTLLIGSGR